MATPFSRARLVTASELIHAIVPARIWSSDSPLRSGMRFRRVGEFLLGTRSIRTLALLPSMASATVPLKSPIIFLKWYQPSACTSAAVQSLRPSQLWSLRSRAHWLTFSTDHSYRNSLPMSPGLVSSGFMPPPYASFFATRMSTNPVLAMVWRSTATGIESTELLLRTVRAFFPRKESAKSVIFFAPGP